jgi:hypothetical protein
MEIMKKLFVCVIAVAMLASCSDRDAEYYEKNPAKAKDRYMECEADAKAALMTKNEEAFQKIIADKECTFAHEALRAYENRKREEKAAEEKRIFLIAYEKESEILKDMEFVEFSSVGDFCKANFTYSNDAKCQAYRAMRESRERDERAAMATQYPGEELEKYRDRVCKGAEFSQLYCQLATKAASDQRTTRLTHYEQNRDDLVRDFNVCHSVYKELIDQKKRREAQLAVDNYECKILAQAARKVRVWNFSKPM